MQNKKYQSKYMIICFNPICSTPNNRLISKNNKQQSHISCKKWLVDYHIYQRLLNPSPIDVNNIKQDESMTNYFQYQQDLKHKINQMYMSIKQWIDTYIESSRLNKLQQIDLLGKELNELKNLVIDGFKLFYSIELNSIQQYNSRIQSISIGLNMMINSSRYKIPQLKDIIFYNIQHLQIGVKEDLQKVMNRFNNSIYIENKLDGGFQRLNYSDIYGVEKIINQYQNNSIELINKLTGWKQSYYLNDNYKIRQIKCPLCTYKYQSNQQIGLAKSKIEFSKILFYHLFQSHFLHITLCYSHRISKTAIIQLPCSQLFYLMRNYNYDQIDIYDVAHHSKNIIYQPNPKCLTILFTNQNVNIDNFQYSYCIVNSPQEAAFYIILLQYQVGLLLGKSIRILNFKKNYCNLLNGIAVKHKINFKFEEKINQQILKSNHIDIKSKKN